MPTQDATISDQVTINVVPEFTGKLPSKAFALFIEQYLVDFNASQAAVRVGKTKKWAGSKGLKALRDYSDYVNWLQRIRAVEHAARVSMSQEDIFDEIENISRANIQDYFGWRTVQFKDGKKLTEKKIRIWKDPGDLTRLQAAAVKRVVLNADGQVTDYVLYDKDSNLVALGRHLGMFSEKVILEHRHKHLHAKVDLSNMPLDTLLEMEKEFVKYLPAHQREAR